MNNLGGLSLLEMNIVAGEVISQLGTCISINCMFDHVILNVLFSSIEFDHVSVDSIQSRGV